jgi:hypothetical protein
MPSLYETDYYAWTEDIAKAIDDGESLNRVDQLALVEELGDMGKAELSKLESALEQLFLHLLKQRYQPEKQSRSWQNSVDKQRFQIERSLKRNPSFQRYLKDIEFIADAYRAAIFDAVEETDLPAETFPDTCPFKYEEYAPPLTKAKHL